MTAEEWIDNYLQQTGSAQPREVILKTLNRRQNLLLGMDTEMLRVTPDPYFFTEDQVYGYIANDQIHAAPDRVPGDLVGRIRVVRQIYSTRQDWGWNNWSPFPFNGCGYNAGRMVIDPFTGDKFVPNMNCVEARHVDTDECTVTWSTWMNPGLHETLWRCRAYQWPVQLLSEQDEITMPDDFVEDLLVWEVQASIDRGAYGRNDVAQQNADATRKRFVTKYASPPFYTRPLQSPALNA